MDGRPLSATIVPILALAVSLAAAAFVVDRQSSSGRADLVLRAGEFATALIRGDVDEALPFVMAEQRLDPRSAARLVDVVTGTLHTQMQLRDVRIGDSSATTVFLVAHHGVDRFSLEAVDRIDHLSVEWTRGADHVWYVRLSSR